MKGLKTYSSLSDASADTPERATNLELEKDLLRIARQCATLSDLDIRPAEIPRARL